MYSLGHEKQSHHPFPPQANGVVKKDNWNLGDMLRPILIGKDKEDWDLLLPQIMRTIRTSSISRLGRL